MNEVREAIERVGARFSPSGDGFDDLSRLRKRARVRRRLMAAALALTVAAGGLILAVRAFPTTNGAVSWPRGHLHRLPPPARPHRASRPAPRRRGTALRRWS
jgi:hypothetical protein